MEIRERGQRVNIDNREGFLTYSMGFLLAMLLVTIALATIGDVRPLTTTHWNLTDAALGAGAAVVMMLCFGFVGSVRKQAEEILGPMLVLCKWHDFIILAILVGIVEELMFRGVLEQWVARFHPLVAMAAVNILFGLLHAVSWEYAIMAAALGGILSLLAQGPGDYNLLRPIVAHAVYDYIGFVWVAHEYRKHQASSRNLPGDGEHASEQEDENAN